MILRSGLVGSCKFMNYKVKWMNKAKWMNYEYFQWASREDIGWVTL